MLLFDALTMGALARLVSQYLAFQCGALARPYVLVTVVTLSLCWLVRPFSFLGGVLCRTAIWKSIKKIGYLVKSKEWWNVLSASRRDARSFANVYRLYVWTD
jgi:hypothetical protein